MKLSPYAWAFALGLNTAACGPSVETPTTEDESNSGTAGASGPEGSSETGAFQLCTPNTNSDCTQPSDCVGGPNEPEHCGSNGMFDAFGCLRERCEQDSDCPSGQLCRDIAPCYPDACIPLLSCKTEEGDCNCLSTECSTEGLQLCFHDDDFTCN